MQYPNNDMDELFRKAAEGYPLNTSTANWEKVHAMLAEETKKDVPPPQGGRLRWLLVLLPILLVGLQLNDSYRTAPQQTANHMDSPATEALPHKATARAGTGQPAVAPAKTGLTSTEKTVRRYLPAAAWTRPSQAFGLTTTYQQPQLVWNLNTQERIEPVLTPPVTQGVIIPEWAGNTPGDSKQEIPVATEETVTRKFSMDSLQQDRREESQQNRNKTNARQKRFYAGIVGGPDLSTVKFQKFSNVGFQVGVLLGYAFNDRFAVEAGALTAKKYYYSDGEYYKTSGSYTPAYARIVAVDGSCRMIEVPVALRYTFSRQKTQSWFATAGVSSYLMQREDYSLDYLYPSSGNISTYYRSYTNKDQYWLAALQLSLGYSTRLGKLGNLRFEPYYSLPLKGMGHGKLPVSSLGVRLGITLPQF
jgi:hypothetical protein